MRRHFSSWDLSKCAALVLASLGPFGAMADSSDSKTLSLSYETSVGDHSTFPDGCENPYKDIAAFDDFFEAAIDELVVDRGAGSKGVAALFAVSEMREQIKDLFPNLSEESPLDRLIISQLCEYQRIAVANPKPGKLSVTAINSGDKSLHDHLAMIAPKLYKDCRKMFVDSLAQQSKLRQKAKRLAERRNDIRRARAEGRALIDDILSSDRPQKQLK